MTVLIEEPKFYKQKRKRNWWCTQQIIRTRIRNKFIESKKKSFWIKIGSCFLYITLFVGKCLAGTISGIQVVIVDRKFDKAV